MEEGDDGLWGNFSLMTNQVAVFSCMVGKREERQVFPKTTNTPTYHRLLQISMQCIISILWQMELACER
jgi:hypothetical protein